MKPSRAYIGLGSNLNQPRRQIMKAISSLNSMPGSQVKKQSSLYRSAPMGPTDQPDYVNAVAAIDTDWEPLELLEQLQAIERRQGRIRGAAQWGPRTLDLDLLLYDDLQVETAVLVIPHPGLHRRAFVLYPLAEIAPDLNIPERGALHGLLLNCPIGDLCKLEAVE